MKSRKKAATTIIGVAFAVLVIAVLGGCSDPLEWPESPLYQDPVPVSQTNPPNDLEAVKQSIVGHYAHYDVVAYQDDATKTPMRTFVVSYGFTDFYLEDGKLMQADRFVHAEQKINQKNITSRFRDEAVQAIKPVDQEVELTFTDGRWRMYRPPTPSLLGITGDPGLPLTEDPDDPNIFDADNDGKPGVTVEIEIGDVIKGELYILRREIYSNYLTLYSDGVLYGHVEDRSEQFVIGASLKILDQPSNPIQHPDPGFSPVLLIPISDDIDTPEELMALRGELFPEEPEFRE